MARETTVEVDIEVSTKYSEKVKKAEERLKKVNKAASKMNTPKKPLTEMEKYQQSIDRTNRLLQKLEKQQKSIGNFSKIETILKANVEVIVKDNGDSKKLPAIVKENTYVFIDNSEMTFLLQEISFKLVECIGTMMNGHLIMMNIEAYLISACNSLRIGNHNNLLWSVLNHTMLSNIYNVLETNNADNINIISELSKINSALNNIKITSSMGDEPKESKNESKEETKDEIERLLDGIAVTSGAVAGVLAVTGVGAIPAAVIGAVGAAPSGTYKMHRSLSKLSDKAFEWFSNEKVVNRDFLSYETIHKETGVKTKYGLGGPIYGKETYNPNTGSIKKYNWLGNVDVEGKILDMSGLNATVANNIKDLMEPVNALTKVSEKNASNQLNPMTMFGLQASQIDARANMDFNPATNLPLNMQGGGIEEKLALIQASSTENMNSLALLWDSYLQKVGLVYDMILLTISMKHMLLTMNTLLTILNLYLTWMTLPPMLEGVWQQILSGADIFLSNLKSKFTVAISEIKQKMAELSSISINPPSSGGGAPGGKYTGTGFWKGGLTYVGERGRELIQYPTGERFMAEAKMLMNLPKGTRIFRNSMTERIMNNGFSGNNMMSADENNQLKKLGGFNGLSDYTDSKFGGGTNYSSVKTDNITINITNTYGNQSQAQIKDTNSDLVRKINDVLFQKEDRKRRVSIG